MPGSEKRKYESARQVQRQSTILAAARRLLEEEGYEGMTMRGLAKMAGVAQGTLYNLYSSKDDLILAAVDDLLTEIGARAIASGLEGVDAILMLGQFTSEQTRATPRYAEAIARALFRTQPDDPMVDVLFARSLPFLKAELRKAQEKNQVRADADINVLARLLVGQAWGVILLWLMGLLPLRDLTRERRRSDLMTLISVCQGRTRSRLEADLQALTAPAL